MTQPIFQALRHTRGDSFDRIITFDEDPATFQAIWFTVRETWADDEADDTDAVAQATLGAGITVTGALTAAITITAADAASWVLPEYVYDVQILTAAGKLRTTQFGQLRLGPDVTRSTT